MDMVELLLQNEEWVDQHRRVLKVAEMSVPHKLNVLALLERKALPAAAMRAHDLQPELKSIELAHGLDRSDGVNAVYDRLSEEFSHALLEPRRWMRGTPLYREMLRQVTLGLGGKDQLERMWREDDEVAAEDATWD